MRTVIIKCNSLSHLISFGNLKVVEIILFSVHKEQLLVSVSASHEPFSLNHHNVVIVSL